MLTIACSGGPVLPIVHTPILLDSPCALDVASTPSPAIPHRSSNNDLGSGISRLKCSSRVGSSRSPAGAAVAEGFCAPLSLRRRSEPLWGDELPGHPRGAPVQIAQVARSRLDFPNSSCRQTTHRKEEAS